MKIALFGATGRVGQAFLRLAGTNEQLDIYALIRSSNDKLGLPKKRIVIGNARCREDVKEVMKDAEIVISCLGTDGNDTLSAAMTHILAIMQEQHIKRLITIGTAGILNSRCEPGKYRFETNESKRKLTRAAKEHAKVYDMLRDSSLDWTMICPTYLPDGEAAGEYRAERNVLPAEGKKITVGDTAAFLYHELLTGDYIGCRVGLAY
ncbi:NAD(P)H-binding protein [Bacillus halotolerans]|uniref:NAD(P)H-binding protein n=1 Tax=Bacillus halotolerans TaxID=260554 RepID=A0ABY7I322_9BACI|nr:NAD(P)H-binding protein [Bacillus halotolerans]MBV5121154.1 NAD(P)H-binding protein [Bacillus halotolerans]MCC2114186.1 NAD(P)H-binding protein [Bacillus halotolerans]MDG0766213.1 NAD(P)H-binding protein [Bacillus halotolerans]UUI85321.1 NAD(P)H-binding protein [Bacillus halotolerans]WAT22374.1 NAD(P)H-binding protein [Bacillus halotolerans]